eukprot:4724960-Prymnesium_polylepis.1
MHETATGTRPTAWWLLALLSLGYILIRSPHSVPSVLHSPGASPAGGAPHGDPTHEHDFLHTHIAFAHTNCAATDVVHTTPDSAHHVMQCASLSSWAAAGRGCTLPGAWPSTPNASEETRSVFLRPAFDGAAVWILCERASRPACLASLWISARTGSCMINTCLPI